VHDPGGTTHAVVCPAGLPPDVQLRLAGALEPAILSPEHGERMRQLNIPITFEGPTGFTAYWAAEECQLRPLLAELLREGRTQ
jgi:tripartite-type tricarboxylate transporter receptor subunit TctC